MYKISKQFTFSAAHQLRGLDSCHPCSRLHGHNYKIELHLKSDILNQHGFVVDYNELSIFKNYIDTTFERRTSL